MQATLVAYFIHAYVDSEGSDLGKLSGSAVWKLLDSFSSDLSGAIVKMDLAFETHMLPVILMCIQSFLDSKFSQGAAFG